MAPAVKVFENKRRDFLWGKLLCVAVAKLPRSERNIQPRHKHAAEANVETANRPNRGSGRPLRV